MPTLRKLCQAPGCGGIAVTGSTYCPPCKAKAVLRERERKRQHDRTRPNSARRGYDKHWRQTRARYLKAHPRCEFDGCSAVAEEVDHIVPIREGGARLQWSNLRSACKHHHSQHTANYYRQGDGRFGPA